MRSDRWKSAARGSAAGALFGVLIFQLISILMTELFNSKNHSPTTLQITSGAVFVFSSACFGALYGFIKPDECESFNARDDREPLIARSETINDVQLPAP